MGSCSNWPNLIAIKATMPAPGIFDFNIETGAQPGQPAD
jgi:hypothetical protein